MSMIRNSVLLMAMLSTVVGLADPVAIPDRIGDNGRVWIDFGSKEIVQYAQGASLLDAADLAGVILETYLRPNVESGCVSTRDISLLNFCFQTFDLQAQRCRIAFEQNMGRSENVEASEVLFYDGADMKKKMRSMVMGIRDRLSCLPFELDGGAASFCALYNAKVDESSLLFCNAQKIHDVLWASRNRKKIEVLALDPEAYGDIPQLKWICGWSSGVGIGMASAGLLSASLGAGAWIFSSAAWAAMVPGPGWLLAGGLTVVGGGVALYVSAENGKREWLKTVKLNNGKIENYLNRVGDRRSYIKEVVENEHGLYQRSYMGLVKVAMLVDNWKRNGWRGLGQLTDKDRKNLNDEATKAREWAKDGLVRLEDSSINYPLLVDLMEASSVCLYLNYLDVKNISRTTTEKDRIRQIYLENAGTVADVCSRLSKYSTGRVAVGHIMAYNSFFSQCYATNRVGLIKPQKEKDVEEYLKKNKALFADEKEGLVRRGYVNPPTIRQEFVDLCAYIDSLQTNSLMNEIVGRKVETGKLETWKREVKCKIEDRLLYPSWSEEVSSEILPEGTDEIVHIISTFSPKEPNADRVRLLFNTVMATDAELSSLESLTNIFSSADTVAEVKAAIVSDYNRRKGDLDAEIKARYGSAEKMIDRWIDKLVLEGTGEGMEGSKLKLSEVAARMKGEILPMWKKIEPIKRKWWRAFF